MEELVISEQYHNIYRNKRVFLTGHTGFKGSWLLLILNQLGATVKGYSLAPENSPNLFELIDGPALCESVIGDIRNKERLAAEIHTFQPDFIFHLAAQALVIESYHNPVETYATNVMGTAHVLDALRSMEKNCYTVIITTDKVYENLEHGIPYKEIDRLGGFDPYSNSKACAELATASFRNSFFPKEKFSVHKKGIATARSGNVIGGGDWSDNRIIPDMIRAFQNDVPVEVRNPGSVRPWQHVLDPLDGYLLLGQKLAEDPVRFGQDYNFGPFPQDEMTVKDLVETGIKHWGNGSLETPKQVNALHEAGLLTLDIQKAIEQLGWGPRMNSKTAVSTTVEWYKEFAGDPSKKTLEQIAHFYAQDRKKS